MSLGAAPVKADPDCAPDQAYIKAGAERGAWPVHVKLEPVDESGDPPPPDNANTLCTGPCGGYCRRGALRDHTYTRTDFPLADECVKRELYAELYAEHTVKDELVLGPERVQRRSPAVAVHAERFILREPSAVPGKALVAGPEPARELLLKKCSVRLERIPLRGPPARARGSDRDTGGDSDDHELYTTLDYEKDLICELCGTWFPLKSDLMKHVVVHNHIPTSVEDSSAADDDYEKEKVGDHRGSDDLARYWWSGRSCRAPLERRPAAREPAPASRPPPHTRPETLHSNNTYHCDICGRTFIRKHFLIRHIEKHMEKCESPNISKVIHKRNHAAKGPYSCECKKEFTVLKDLLVHIRTSKGNNIYSCAVCKQRFLGRIDLENHTRTHTGEKPFSCEICKRRFSQLGSLKTHKVNVHGVGNTSTKPSCTICNKRFVNSYSLKRHERIHTGERPFSCEICKKEFRGKGSLKTHKFILHGIGDISLNLKLKIFSCEICNKQFARSSSLKIHKQSHTGEKPYPCEICNKRFVYPSLLKIHKRIHTGERPYTCEICNKRCVDSYSLKTHMQIHTGERPYPCEICNKGFAYSSLLQRHKLIHTGERPYTCEICNMRFIHSYSLKIHKRIHTGEKPYPCEICNMRFVDWYSLKIHKRIHTGERPYPCEICNRRFVNPYSLKIHKRIHTGERPYPCDICKKRFNQLIVLKKHKRIHTREIEKNGVTPL